MTIDDYARDKAAETWHNCEGKLAGYACEDCVKTALASAYTQGAADQKRGAVAALNNIPRRGSATGVVALIAYRDAIRAVRDSQPESDARKAEK